MFGKRQIHARIERLNKLQGGLAEEEARQRKLAWLVQVSAERLEYIAAIQKAQEAIGRARDVLEKAAIKLASFSLD